MPRKANVPDRIERKENIPDKIRTDEKDRAADWLEENVLKPGRWNDLTLSEIGEESEWSRQHITNVVKEYYKDATDSEQTQGTEIEAVYVGNPPQKKEIPVPNDVADRESFIRGYLAATE